MVIQMINDYPACINLLSPDPVVVKLYPVYLNKTLLCNINFVFFSHTRLSYNMSLMLGSLSAHYVASFGCGWSKRPADMEGSCECVLNIQAVTDGVVWSVASQSMSKIFTFKHICNVDERTEILWLCFIEGVTSYYDMWHGIGPWQGETWKGYKQ